MKRAAIALRVSTKEQADSRLGLDAQLRLCTELLQRELPDNFLFDVFSDPGVSGSIPLAERKDGRRLTEAIAAGQIDVVVALTQDRLFRGLLDMLATLERWDDLGVRVLLVDGGWLDLDDDDKWMMTVMRGMFAEKERRDARKRTKRALRAAKERGQRVGGVPFGMRATARVVEGKKVNGGVYVPVPDEQSVIQQVRELRQSGKTFRAVAAELNRMHVPAPRGGEWHGEVVRRMLMR